MTARLVAASLLALALAVAACASPAPSPSATPGGAQPAGDGDPAAIGRAYIEALASGDTTAAEAMEDDTMRAAAPASALAGLWTQITGQFGAYQGILSIETAASDPYVNATVTAGFADATVPLVVTVDTDGRVAGLHLGQPGPAPSGSSAPASPTASPAAASYVDPAAFTETETTVGADPWALPGTLSMPMGEGPVPAVVLVAGSGPNDRDETIGPNKPLRDIAGALASNGIAVLRYDKRTKVHGAAMANSPVTVQEEVVDDAVAAVELLRATPGVDPARVYVVGHSLGGFLAPRIAAEADGSVAGIGVLAGSTSALQDLVLKQYEYLASEAGGADPAAAAALPTIREQVALVSSGAIDATTPATSLPLGIPAAYWLDLAAYDPTAVVASLPIPVFVAQGGRDYQVPPTELAGWRAALGDRADATIREYPTLNHLLMAGDGPSRPSEYMLPGHVAPELVADLVAWVQGS